MKTDPDLAKWCAALSAAVVTEEVPEGWYTTRQLSQKLGKALPTMGAQLNRAVAEGRCERKLFRITSGSVTRPIPHYKLT